METQESLNRIASLRLRLQMNRRLRLESLAALSKVFREFGEPLEDELLASFVFALPEELLGESASIKSASQKYGTSDTPTPTPDTPTGTPIGTPTGTPTGTPIGTPTGTPTGTPPDIPATTPTG